MIKIFSLLSAVYNFSPILVNSDFNMGKIKSLKDSPHFKNKPYVIYCFFHFCQSIINKLNKFKIIKYRTNKRGFELLHNIEILCFIEKSKIKEIFSKRIK